MIYEKKLKVIFFMVSLYSFSNAQITEISNILEVATYLVRDDKEKIALFDLDNVVIHPQAGVGSEGSSEFWSKKFNEVQQRQPTKSLLDIQKDFLPDINAAHKAVESKLVQDEFKILIQELKNAGFKIMALTGRFGEVSKETVAKLSKLGINLHTYSPVSTATEIVLPDNSCYVDGVLFCGFNNKGSALSLLFDAIQYKPSFVVFVDDKEKNLEHVQAALKVRNIAFQGLRYAYLDEKIQTWNNSVQS